ncbi:MAG: glycine--tRNA ligase subunit beta [Pseudomonadota bacterium]
MADLLLELFSEEIPARMQARASEDLKRLVTGHMVEAGLTYADARAFAGPRRLTLVLGDVPEATMATREERKGPRADAPEKAIEGFLRSTGLTRDQLETRADKKGDVLFSVIDRPGRPAEEVIAEAVEAAVRNFPWPKSMRWGTGSLRWVRPLRRILCTLSDESGSRVVPFEIDGIASGDVTEGHRVHGDGPIRVAGFEDYAAKLEAAKVVVDAGARTRRIEHELTQQAFALGLEVVTDPGLMTEVTGLAEWPVVLVGQIEERFLALPPEVLQTSMREHQKFFSLRNPATGRIERFATVANLDAPDGGAAILAGNGRVLAARLSDAAFFWENDLRTIKARGLEGMGEALAAVTFHEKLGSQADRVARIAALAREIAPSVGARPDLAAEAARVAKADLASEMVYEFPELQGVMGRFYAAAAGHDDGVPEACEAHYRPLGPTDAVPDEPVAIAVALADKIDMLSGFWAIDEKPTGSKDPFALRRAALGAIRTVLEAGLRLRLRPLGVSHFALISDAPTPQAEAMADSLLAFIADRLKVALRDQGVRHDVIQACFDLGGQDDLVLLVARVRALQDFLATEDGANLLAAYRRAANIVAAEAKKEPEADFAATPDPASAVEPAETVLFEALAALQPRVEAALVAEDFAAAMGAMAELRAPVDAFFDDVTVNAADPGLRLNRLRLLSALSALMSRVADWEGIEG